MPPTAERNFKFEAQSPGGSQVWAMRFIYLLCVLRMCVLEAAVRLMAQLGKAIEVMVQIDIGARNLPGAKVRLSRTATSYFEYI